MKKLNLAIIGQGRSGRDIHGKHFKSERNTKFNVVAIVELDEVRRGNFTDEDIREMYRPKDEYPANAKFVAENDKESLAQVFTDIRYPRSLNEEVSAALLPFLKKQRFL